MEWIGRGITCSVEECPPSTHGVDDSTAFPEAAVELIEVLVPLLPAPQ